MTRRLVMVGFAAWLILMFWAMWPITEPDPEPHPHIIRQVSDCPVYPQGFKPKSLPSYCR